MTMRAFLIFCLIIFASKSAYSQTAVCDTVYSVVEEMPKFKNGDLASLSKEISKLRFKSSCEDLSFKIVGTITKEGRFVDVKVHGVTEACEDGIANQLMQLLSEWTPGKLNGHPVCVMWVMPLCIKTAN